jgi:hypothetical protein
MKAKPFRDVLGGKVIFQNINSTVSLKFTTHFIILAKTKFRIALLKQVLQINAVVPFVSHILSRHAWIFTVPITIFQ